MTMEHKLNHHILAAEMQIQKQEFEKAIDSYLNALDEVSGPEQKIDIYNNLAQLFARTGKSEEALNYYQLSLSAHNEVRDASLITLKLNRAGIYNNMGALLGANKFIEAINHHNQALAIIRELYEVHPEEFIHHLMNTIYTLAGIYYRSGDLYHASKFFNEVIEKYKPYEDQFPTQVKPMLASTYFQLGLVRSDQDKDEDARTLYHKSKYLYEKLTEEDPDTFRPYLASVYNNLAVVDRLIGYLSDSKNFYKKTVEQYGFLAEQEPQVYLPYYASSLNNTANVYADSWNPEDDVFSGDRGFLPGFGLFNSSAEVGLEKVDAISEEDFEEAVKHYKEALHAYQILANQEPEHYEHYCATTLHNLGVLYDENKLFDKAEHYYKEALAIRQKLARNEPHAFDLDVCITQMNMVTMYQTLMERAVDYSYKTKCLDLIKDTEDRLGKYELETLPESIQAMEGDLSYFKDYFNRITEADLVAIDLSVKADALNEEAYSTLDLEKRLSFQEQIQELYFNAMDRFPNNQAIFTGWEMSKREVEETKNALEKQVNN